MKINYYFFIFCLSVGLTFSQPRRGEVDPLVAKEHFSNGNFLYAIRSYSSLVVSYPKDFIYNYRLGLCYLYTNIDKNQAVKYLLAASKLPDADNEVWYDLGKAYHQCNKFEDAIKSYTKFKEKAKSKDFEKADHQIEMCRNGIEYTKFPLKVTFENLGKEINSEFPDYYPFVTADESFLVFTSRREANIGGSVEVDGYYSSDIYRSNINNGNWTKAKNIGAAVNTRLDEQAVSLSSDGKDMIVYIDHIDSLGNIYQSSNDTRSFRKLVKLNSNVNSDFETSGSISADGNLIFFASNRSSGFGGSDIYMSKKLPNGQWALPQNLGKEINSAYNEDFPRLADDGKTLFFSSEGHSSMGGYDIFKSTWNEEANTWSTPRNIGFPVNDGNDNRTVSPTKNERVLYLSALREKGFGDLDIYRVTYDNSETLYSVVSGYILTADTANKIKEASIFATDIKTKKEFNYLPNPATGKYVMALTPGVYTVTVEASGFDTLSEKIEVYDKGSYVPEIKKDFQLLKNGAIDVKPATPPKK